MACPPRGDANPGVCGRNTGTAAYAVAHREWTERPDWWPERAGREPLPRSTPSTAPGGTCTRRRRSSTPTSASSRPGCAEPLEFDDYDDYEDYEQGRVCEYCDGDGGRPLGRLHHGMPDVAWVRGSVVKARMPEVMQEDILQLLIQTYLNLKRGQWRKEVLEALATRKNQTPPRNASEACATSRMPAIEKELGELVFFEVEVKSPQAGQAPGHAAFAMELAGIVTFGVLTVNKHGHINTIDLHRHTTRPGWRKTSHGTNQHSLRA